MPELPEVQTIVNTLNHSGLLNHKMIDILVYKPKLLKNSNVINFKKFLVNESINQIERIGKYLIFKLNHDKVMVVHLRMEGKLFYEPLKSSIPNTHLRIEFIFDNQHTLRFYDSRMFGTFDIYRGNDYLKSKQIAKLALDPLAPNFDANYIKQKLGHSTKHIKPAILDQSNIAGIGNIYADEILFLCKLNPLKKANTLSEQNYKDLVKYSKQVLKLALKHGGTTVSSYKPDPEHSGYFQTKLLVHTKKDQPCSVCGTIIKKMKVNGRGTYYCPKCQK